MRLLERLGKHEVRFLYARSVTGSAPVLRNVSYSFIFFGRGLGKDAHRS